MQQMKRRKIRYLLSRWQVTYKKTFSRGSPANLVRDEPFYCGLGQPPDLYSQKRVDDCSNTRIQRARHVNDSSSGHGSIQFRVSRPWHDSPASTRAQTDSAVLCFHIQRFLLSCAVGRSSNIPPAVPGIISPRLISPITFWWRGFSIYTVAGTAFNKWPSSTLRAHPFRSIRGSQRSGVKLFCPCSICPWKSGTSFKSLRSYYC